MNTDGLEFQYDLLGGLGGAVAEQSEPLANGHATQEEQFISLLDVLEDDNKAVPKLEELKPSEPESRSNPAQANGDVGSFDKMELPWVRASRDITSPTLRLHNEIVEFCKFLEPTPEEEYARESSLERISDLVKSMFPSARIQLFGSYLTGLYLPTSDMDVVVTNSGCDDIPRALRAIGNVLVEQGMGKNIQVIAKAKVPIVKFDDVATGLAFDISFDVANGPKAAEYVVKVMKGLPGMLQLVKILKLFLQQRELNEVYQGGIGSYALLVMVAAFLMQHPSRKHKSRGGHHNLEGNLGILLLDFFRLYGRTLDMEHVVVSCRKEGVFYTKKSKPSFVQYDRPYNLAVEDPQDEENDLSRGSYNISRVQKAFDYAYQQLSSPIDPADSALERIIRLDAVLMSRSGADAAEAPPPPPPLPPSEPHPDDLPKPSARKEKSRRKRQRDRGGSPEDRRNDRRHGHSRRHSSESKRRRRSRDF